MCFSPEMSTANADLMTISCVFYFRWEKMTLTSIENHIIASLKNSGKLFFFQNDIQKADATNRSKQLKWMLISYEIQEMLNRSDLFGFVR